MAITVAQLVLYVNQIKYFLSLNNLLLSAGLAGLSLYLWVYTYWWRRGVPTLTPAWPIFGNLHGVLFKKTIAEASDDIYRRMEDLPFVGIYAFHTPVFFVRNLDLISDILVNNASHFEDRGFHFNESDPLGRNLIHQKEEDWKFSRGKLIPCFSVAKVKSMLDEMKVKSENLLKKVNDDCEKKGFAEVWDASVRYAVDVLTSSFIGVDADSLKNDEEQFREIGEHCLGLYFIFHVMTGCFFPKLHKWLSIPVAKSEVTAFFKDVVHQAMSYRSNKNIGKRDLLQTLIDSKGCLNEKMDNVADIDDNFIIAQIFICFLAGFETPGNVMASALYEIAKRSEIQKTIQLEIEKVLKQYDGEITFDALQDMKYLRQVFSEALRLYSPLTLIFRRCTKEYRIPGTKAAIERGTLVLVPLRSIHEDPSLYPDPLKFQPDRFADEKCAGRHIAAYMPFGIGPRICPAVLYSNMAMRTACVKILREFEVGVVAQTPKHYKPSPVDFLLTPHRSLGIPLKFKRRAGPEKKTHGTK